jgi:hypothetical protein
MVLRVREATPENRASLVFRASLACRVCLDQKERKDRRAESAFQVRRETPVPREQGDQWVRRDFPEYRENRARRE